MTTKEEILNYVMKSPENTNRAVLESLLDGFGGDYNPSQVTYPVYKRVTESLADPTLIKNITQYPGALVYIEDSEITGSWTFVSINAYNANGEGQVGVPAEKDSEGILFLMPDPNYISDDPTDGPYAYLEILVDQK